jgi:CxxC-x17-CxxC domain-containing protein
MSDIPMNRDVTYFARTNFRGGNEMFGIKRKDRRQHMYILGKSGTGKSALMSNLIIQNVWNGEGLCLVDPHGELVETVLKSIPEHRIKDVVYFNPADTEFCIGFNPLELHDPKYKHLVASGLMGIFTKIWANVWSARMEYIMNNTILALLDTPGSTLLGITRMLVDKDYRQIIIGNVKDPMVKAFWVHEFEQWKEQFRNEAIAPIQNKVGQFLSSSIIRNIVGQQQSTIDIFEMMNQGKIFLVNVSKGRIGEDNSALLGAMIITKIQLAVMERVRIPEEERRDFYLYVDEFQNFATDSFASILSEARKYRLCLTLAHQYTAQISGGDDDLKDAVFGNVGSMIIFRVGAEDAKDLEKEFAPEFIPEDFVGLPNYQIYLKLMIDGITSRPFSANTLPPIKIDSGSDTTEKVIDESRKQFCKPQSQVESAIISWSSTSGGSTMKQTINKTTGQTMEMYDAVCLNCNKEISVPFEPKQGKPIYCKECLHKIKVGEIKSAKGFYDKNQNDGPKPAEALAVMGIEYEPEIISKNTKVFEPRKETGQFYKTHYKNNSNPKKDEFLKTKTGDNEGFSSLKDLLIKINPEQGNLNKNKPITQQKQISSDPKKVTLHPILKENLIINKQKNTNLQKPEILKPKAASYESQQKLKDLINSNNQKNNIDSPSEPVPVIKNNEPINLNKKIDEDMNHFVPKPPESYTKRIPQKEVPEEILREIFTEEEK